MKSGILIGALFLGLLAAVITVIILVRVPNMYEVNGEGVVKYTPDEAAIFSSIYVENDVPLDAVKEAASTMRNILTALKAAGVADKDVKSTLVKSGPVESANERDRSAGEKRAYFAEQAVSIAVKDLKQIGPILDAISNAGSNYWRVTYGASDAQAEKLEAEVRKAAFQNAIAIADQYANQGHFKRGRVLKIQDESVDFPDVDYSGREYRTSHSKITRSSGVEKVTVTGTRSNPNAIPDTTFNIPPPKELSLTATTHVLFAID